jgi:hypothetical protein
MPISLADSQTLNELAHLLYDFLPGSGNNNTSFPIAANRAGVAEYWVLNGSKRPAIVQLLSLTYEHRRSRFCPLVVEVVQLGMIWRRSRAPLTREEVDRLNALMLRLGFKIPDLHDARFLDDLPRAAPAEERRPAADAVPDRAVTAKLNDELLAIATFEPQKRGYSFESFLNRLFSVYGLAPREPFRNRGEQIDGSFVHRHETFLLEAKWQAAPIGSRELRAFALGVETKAAWARGMFVSYSGFTRDGLHAFRQGKPTPIICVDGLDLSQVLVSGLSLTEVFDRKMRWAAETGDAFVSVRDLFPSI